MEVKLQKFVGFLIVYLVFVLIFCSVYITNRYEPVSLLESYLQENDIDANITVITISQVISFMALFISCIVQGIYDIHLIHSCMKDRMVEKKSLDESIFCFLFGWAVYSFYILNINIALAYFWCILYDCAYGKLSSDVCSNVLSRYSYLQRNDAIAYISCSFLAIEVLPLISFWYPCAIVFWTFAKVTYCIMFLIFVSSFSIWGDTIKSVYVWLICFFVFEVILMIYTAVFTYADNKNQTIHKVGYSPVHVEQRSTIVNIDEIAIHENINTFELADV